MCMRLADRKQGYRWIITKKGPDLYQNWRWHQWKRDAEAMVVLPYTDYSDNGTGEDVENMVLHRLLPRLMKFAIVSSFVPLTQ